MDTLPVANLIVATAILRSMEEQQKKTENKMEATQTNKMSIEEFKNKCEKEGLKEGTIRGYLSFLKKLERTSGKTVDEWLKDEEGLFLYIKEKRYIKDGEDDITVKTNLNHLNTVKTYMLKAGFESKYFIEKVDEFRKMPIPKKKKEVQEETIDLTKLKEKFEEVKKDIKNKNHKLLLSIVLNHAVQRNDLANVKIRNFKITEPHYADGKIIYPPKSCNKVPNAFEIVLELTEEEIQLIDYSKGDYLINSIISPDRPNAYGRLLAENTQKYLGVRVGQNKFRHVKSTDVINKALEISPGFFEAYEMLSKAAFFQNHSLDTMLKHYYDVSEFDIDIPMNFDKITQSEQTTILKALYETYNVPDKMKEYIEHKVLEDNITRFLQLETDKIKKKKPRRRIIEESD
ncbi:hypothetical protein HK103_003298 [Boothiomyces macroporosus]|uniref:Uncharacterized protein n=1 Tax=Boothiomyces macroporosus TaxID=261099 RepID=A0AAD5U900_9FUNG|nr:hypothetical protein HK103_003298 [Boothiomyces macroporosus]